MNWNENSALSYISSDTIESPQGTRLYGKDFNMVKKRSFTNEDFLGGCSEKESEEVTVTHSWGHTNLRNCAKYLKNTSVKPNLNST